MMENIDLDCALLGKRLADKVDEKLLTDALSVLQEQGLYAFFLFIQARGKESGERMRDECKRFLEKTPQGAPLFSDEQKGDVFQKLQGFAESLDNLLFARDLLMQALVYARYHAKGRGESKP